VTYAATYIWRHQRRNSRGSINISEKKKITWRGIVVAKIMAAIIEGEKVSKRRKAMAKKRHQLAHRKASAAASWHRGGDSSNQTAWHISAAAA